ncbi:sortase domain-containing protein [Acidipropionibacterium virtanenii]|uniref:Sortase n=1 Tax=Acidipropionibacterium virtanenii TaxID=2057246 RepID=A0A344UWN4_9ACTN|nr:sortase [Acidipropionibacterium virtanenii]AXE39682.1 hypothetical protein JS278_02544 [Acidipropionibacterium virtanenii]
MSRLRLRPFGWTVVSLVALIVAAALWAGWTWWGSTLPPGDRARAAASSAARSWSASPSPSASTSKGPAEGDLIAVMRIPRLGSSWAWPVYASTDDADSALADGLAWYRDTALPGQKGNFAVAGRSATGANGFRDLRKLHAGDDVVVETASSVFTYRIDVAPASLTVRSTDDWVLDPVPGHADATAQQPLITLTTGQDMIATSGRSVAMGHLVSARNR